MKIESLKQLDKLMILCRKRGVSSITIDGVTFHMDGVPQKSTNVPRNGTMPDYSNDFPEANIPVPKFTGEVETPEPVATEDLSPEQLLFYSVSNQADSQQQ